MPGKIRIIKGKVVVEGSFTASEEGILRARHSSRRTFEFWRTHHRSLSCLLELSELEELSLINAKVEDPSALSGLKTLRTLRLNGVKVSAGLEFLAGLSQVETLHLLNMRGPLTLPDLGGLAALRTFRVWGCRGLADVSPLTGAPNLEEVELIDTGLEPDDLTALLEKPSVQYIHAQFRTKKHNDLFVERLNKLHKKRFREH